jgi:FKBP-type peptidyl-prolyl cis-trans isomerase
MKMKVRSLLAAILGVVIFISCNDGPDTPNDLQQWLDDIAKIDEYLDANGITAIEDPSGIRMVITSLGSELPAKATSGVDVDYIGRRFTDKFVFDEGNARNSLTNLIDGWEAALTKLPEGSSATIYIPSLLGYGTAGRGPDIPGNAILEFDIVFNEVVYSSGEITRLEQDISAIDNYLTSKGIEAVEDPTGLRYVITQTGGGPTATWYDQVKFGAAFRLLANDEEVVADIDFAPSENNFNRVIDQIPHGLKTALQKVPEGSKVTLYVPSGLAYGPEGATNGSQQVIPSNANVIIEVELLDVIGK